MTGNQPRQPIITAEMIASNVSAIRRVAPDPDDISIIDDIYEFAAKLRAGSGSGISQERG